MAPRRRQDSSLNPERSPEPCVEAAEALASTHQADADESGGADLNFNEARAALELVLAELQASDLDVEAMAGLYQRGRIYAQRCETILDQVEQEVLVWDDLANPEGAPVRYDPEPDPS
jgi:exodeoxyribonuclease VII small subunit